VTQISETKNENVGKKQNSVRISKKDKKNSKAKLKDQGKKKMENN